MKHHLLFFTLITAAVIATGCDKQRTTSQQLDGVETKAAEVAQNIKAYSFAQRDDFVKMERLRLTDLNRDLDELAARVEKSSAVVQADAQPRIDILRDQTARLNRQLDDASNATESSWEKFKAEVSATRDASIEEFNKARHWLSDKIAP